MAEDTEQPKRPARVRRETMQPNEAALRTPHYLPDLGRSVLAVDAAEAVEIAKQQDNEEPVNG